MQKQKTIKQKSIRMEGEHMHAQRHFRSIIKPSLNLQNLPILEYCCPVFVNHLECSLCLVNTTPNGKVVNGGVLDDSFFINDKKSSQSNSLKLKP